MDGDGNKYDTVVIGTQTWLTENLKTTKYINGDPIPYLPDNTAWAEINRGAYCWYENNINYKDSHGALYNWYAAQLKDFICPVGYNVPTMDEWSTLIDFLESAPEVTKQSFNIKPVGYRTRLGIFVQHPCYWWIYSPDGSSYKISEGFTITAMPKNPGYSIRCIKSR